MTDPKRQRILDKIRKLQAKTTAMGCTEAEALAAAQAVGHLLDEYGLTLTDVELQSTECVEDSVRSPFVTNRHPIRYWKMFQSCGSAILSVRMRHAHMMEGNDDYPSLALPLLPRHRSCSTWHVA